MKTTLLILTFWLSGCAAWERPVVYRESQFANRLEYLRFCTWYHMNDGRCID